MIHSESMFNLPILEALATHRARSQAPPTGTLVKLDLGGQELPVDRCEDGVLRLPRPVVEQLIGLNEDELASLMPKLLSQHEVRLLSITVNYGPRTASAGLLLTKLADELRRLQALVNFSGPEIREAEAKAGAGVLLTPTLRLTS